ncbi:MAG: HEPN domain-containing protein [archaeon]
MQHFLTKLKTEGKLELVEPSKNISEAYGAKANDCLRAAKVLHDARLYENSIAQSYYAMYNAIQSCLFRTGIKCENHTAAIFLIRYLFEKPLLEKKILAAKKERIDRQYYVTGEQNEPVTKESSLMMIKDAESSLIELQLLQQRLFEKDIKLMRAKISMLT